MRRAFNSLVAAGILTLSSGLATVSPAFAQTSSVDVSLYTNNVHPAVGCYVLNDIHVNSADGPVSGADVALTLSVDGDGTVISTERGVTDGSGNIQLGFDTSDAPNKMLYLEVAVNGSYLGGQSVWPDGSSCSGEGRSLKVSGGVLTVSDTVVNDASEKDHANKVEASGSGHMLSPVLYAQQRNLSCEYASVQIATSMVGPGISEYTMESMTPYSANPHWGYRGDINGWWLNTTDYGVYAEALAPGLNEYGYSANVFYGGSGQLTSALDAGKPTIVWLGMVGDESHVEYTEDGTAYQLTRGMHVMVAYGYDEGGVYLVDPAIGDVRYYDWGTFQYMWSIMDGMALSVGY